MADDTKPRAVSGEIMAGREIGDSATAGKGAAPVDSSDVIDADYISLPAGSSGAEVAPVAAVQPQGRTAISLTSVPPAGLDMLRGRETARPSNPTRGGPLFWITGAALVVASFWVSGGHALVRDMAFMGEQNRQSALRISGVTSRIDASGARSLLLVDGEVANDGKTTEHLPTLEIAVTGNDNLVTRYRLGTSGRPLAPGETFTFSSRLDAPTSGVRTVSVTFVE